MFSKILIPVDETEVSATVLTRCSRLLEIPGVHVKLITVAPVTPAQAADPRYRNDSLFDPLRAMLDVLRDQLLRRIIPAKAEVLFGEPATEILREVARGEFDLIAMNSHGRAGLSRVLFGSVAQKVLQASPVPLLLFRPLLRPDGTTSPVDPPRAAPFQRILVPLDGSENAEEIFAVAETLARVTRATLVFFTAIPGGPEEATARGLAMEYLSRRAAAFGLVGLKTEAIVRPGAAAEEILALARDREIDAIAMCTHGHSGAGTAAYGSNAERILSRAHVPLIVLRNRRYRAAMTRNASQEVNS